MAAEGKGKEKDPVNIVHQNAIFCETVHKEQRHQKLYTSFGTNPYKKSKVLVVIVFFSKSYYFCLVFSCQIVHALSGKPNSTHDSGDGEEDGKTKHKVIHTNTHNHQRIQYVNFMYMYFHFNYTASHLKPTYACITVKGSHFKK